MKGSERKGVVRYLWLTAGAVSFGLGTAGIAVAAYGALLYGDVVLPGPRLRAIPSQIPEFLPVQKNGGSV